MYWILPLILLLFSGCTLPWQNSPMPQNQTVPKTSQKSLEKPRIQNLATKPIKNLKPTGYIKGVIQSLKWDDAQGLWVYEVAGSDTKNGKLSHAIFTHTQSIHGQGVLIYAQIEDGKLIEMFRVSGNQLLPTSISKPNSPAIKKEPIQKPTKRTKVRQKIAPPETETIQLD